MNKLAFNWFKMGLFDFKDEQDKFFAWGKQRGMDIKNIQTWEELNPIIEEYYLVVMGGR